MLTHCETLSYNQARNLILGRAGQTRNRMRRSGFTLIEVVIVIVLIGIMASFFFPRIGQSLRRQDVSSARNAVTTLLAKARAAAVQRGRGVAFIHRSNSIIVLSNHPVTGVVDTVDNQNLSELLRSIDELRRKPADDIPTHHG